LAKNILPRRNTKEKNQGTQKKNIKLARLMAVGRGTHRKNIMEHEGKK
jgi:hypothetical protein